MTPSELGLGPPPWIVGHRGAGGEAPENTLDSLLLAVDQRADMVELDIQLTADGELVACHDWTLARMGGIEATIEEALFDDIAGVEISGPFRRPGVHRVLATLDEVLTLVPSSTLLDVELKRRQADIGAFVRALVEPLATRPGLLVSSFDWPLLGAVHAALPDLPVAPLGGSDADPVALLAAADELAAVSVHCRDTLADAALIKAAKAAGRPVLVYTVNEPVAARRLFDLDIEGVFTDFPGRLRRQLAEPA
jgi:glycerophosphoryl diester phosphodiesterase